ncbi:MAG: hypothetical protein R3E13_06620 [Alphaproteobacteria bacterium]
MPENNSKFYEHYAKLNILYLERVLDIEKMFARNVAYISLASIVVSLLFLNYINTPIKENDRGLNSLCLLFVSWGFFVASLGAVAVMTFFSAIFKDIMFEGSLKKMKDDSYNLYLNRSHWSGTVVYSSAFFASLFFLIALSLLLVFMAQSLLLL